MMSFEQMSFYLFQIDTQIFFIVSLENAQTG